MRDDVKMTKTLMYRANDEDVRILDNLCTLLNCNRSDALRTSVAMMYKQDSDEVDVVSFPLVIQTIEKLYGTVGVERFLHKIAE